MKKHIKTGALALTFVASSLAFASCNESEIKGEKDGSIEGSEYHGQEVNPDDPALKPDTNTVTGMDPEGTGGATDEREDSLNSGK